MDLEKYRRLFVEETFDHVAEMSTAMAALERAVSGAESSESVGEAIDTLFRMAHSIKGMAASLEYTAAASLSHALEDWMEPFRASGELPDDFPLIYEVIAAIESGGITRGSLVELGSLVNGSCTGRQRDSEITMFKSVGLAAQDLCAAARALTRAREHDIGLQVVM